jgi:hypothetical protein
MIAFGVITSELPMISKMEITVIPSDELHPSKGFAPSQ